MVNFKSDFACCSKFSEVGRELPPNGIYDPYHERKVNCSLLLKGEIFGEHATRIVFKNNLHLASYPVHIHGPGSLRLAIGKRTLFGNWA